MPSLPLGQRILGAIGALFLLASLSLPAVAAEGAEGPAAVVPAVAPTAGPSEKVREANGECFACHSEAGIKAPPKEGMDLKKLKGLLQDPAHFYGADHQKLLCTKCHSEGYDDFPHEPNAKESTGTCTDCHSKKASIIEKQFDKSVHAELSDTITCTTCHNPHLMRVADKLGDTRKIVAQDNRVCLDCHDSEERFAKFAPEKKKRPQIDDIHDWLPNTRLHWKAVRCVECHTPAVAAGE
ncbi:cytochrome c3 family protein, partial [Propionivibrio dicarboxylicus]